MFNFTNLFAIAKSAHREFPYRKKLLNKHNYIFISPEHLGGVIGILIRIPENTELDLLGTMFKFRKSLPRTEKNMAIIQKAIGDSGYIIKEKGLNDQLYVAADNSIREAVRYYFNTSNKKPFDINTKTCAAIKSCIPMCGICKSTVPFYHMDIDEYSLYMELNGFCKIELNKYI